MQVSVIMAVYNRAPLLSQLLDAWRLVDRSTPLEYELIFSDDESSDDSVEVLEACRDLPIRVLRNRHSGASGARNAAWPHARGELVIFTGDDIFPQPDFVNQHWASYQKNGPGFATLGRIEWRPGIEQTHLMTHITEIGCEQFGFSHLTPYATVDFRHFYTSNISVPHSQLEKLEFLFDRRFRQYGFEDIELGYRLCKQGIRITYNPDILVFHDHVYSSVHSFCQRQISAGMELATFQKLHSEMTDEEIQVDLTQLNCLLEEYSKSAPALDLFADIGRLFLAWGGLITVFCERVMRRRKSPPLAKLCSQLYRAIFAHAMHTGIALGSSVSKENVALASRFAFRYLCGGCLAVSVTHPQTGTQSLQTIRLMGQRNIAIKTAICQPGSLLRLTLEGEGWKWGALTCQVEAGNHRTEVPLQPSPQAKQEMISSAPLPPQADRILLSGQLRRNFARKLCLYLRAN